ncbi:MAG: hypothetical protein HOW73_27390 [Polyangiaceae bacterium]|nr:hypothetical protein [Polyangiaceae bacterium]
MRKRSRVIDVFGLIVAASACEPAEPSPGSDSATAIASVTDNPNQVLPIAVEGTHLIVHKQDGTRAADDELIGAKLLVSVDGGPPQLLRVDSIEADPADKTGEILLYAFSSQDPQTGLWRNVCPADPNGLQRGFLLSGSWTQTGEHVKDDSVIELACTSGGEGKCLRLGYLPWKSDKDFARHQACTRMMRADYCGDGTSYTKNGTLINVYDPETIQNEDPTDGLEFEAAWGPEGAICVKRTRIPENGSLDDLVRACPNRLTGRTGEGCSEAIALADPNTLVLNTSKPR